MPAPKVLPKDLVTAPADETSPARRSVRSIMPPTVLATMARALLRAVSILEAVTMLLNLARIASISLKRSSSLRTDSLISEASSTARSLAAM